MADYTVALALAPTGPWNRRNYFERGKAAFQAGVLKENVSSIGSIERRVWEVSMV